MIEAEAATASSEAAYLMYGRRMKAIRERADLTVREAARKAGVNKNTILRLEAGCPIRESTRARICAAYGVFNLNPEDLADREATAAFAVHRPERSRWHRARLKHPDAPSEVSSDAEMQQATERRRQGMLALANQFFTRLDCDRPEGKIKAALLEVYGPSGYSRQPSGEAFVFALKGSLRFTVAGETFVLDEGCAATFDRTLWHMHEPAPSMNRQDLPVLLLYAQVD